MFLRLPTISTILQEVGFFLLWFYLCFLGLLCGCFRDYFGVVLLPNLGLFMDCLGGFLWPV